MNLIESTVDSAVDFTAPRAQRSSDAEVVLRVYAGLRSIWMLTNEQLNAIAGLPRARMFDPTVIDSLTREGRTSVLGRMIGALDVASRVRERFGEEELSWLHQRNRVFTDWKPVEMLEEDGGAELLLAFLA